MMKNLRYIIIMMAIVLSSCQIEDIPDPNNPSVSDITANATLSDLQLLVSGTESLLRTEMGFYYDVLGIVGREYYFFTNSDPRYTGEVLGKGDATLDNAGFYGTRPYASRYTVVKNTNILMEAVANTKESLTTEQKNGYIGYAKTLQAYSLLLVLNMQYDNGIRVDVADPDNLGPFVGYSAALSAISSILDDAYSKLTSAGTDFKFTLSSGFSGFDTPATFAQFNKAIKARVELYNGNSAAAITALGNSFFNITGNLDLGPMHFYSDAGTDIQNPVYRTRDVSEALVAHPSFISDISANDDRINKVTARTSTAVLDGLSGDYDVSIYSSFADNIPIIRNEELILIYAEANIGTDNAKAIVALDAIRSAHGLAPYAGGITDAEVIDELLYNRRYSLFGEAHRWIDMRRFGKLNTLPLDRVNDDVWSQFPRPVTEIGVQGG